MIIETDGLTKIYGNKTACSNINLSVEAGQVFGFLGPNGAGKSTCIKMLTGLVSLSRLDDRFGFASVSLAINSLKE